MAAGRYRLGPQIGRGSFGDVYIAEELAAAPGTRPREAVLKILHPQWAQVEQVVQRFRRESQVRIDHPHVAQVFEYGQLEDGVPFIAMEYLPGHPLRKAMQQGRMELPRALAILSAICEAMAAAHRVGVVHRDLKPENVQLVERNGNPHFPVVLDFGVAKFLDAAERLTMTGAVLGTPAYMSPEQFRGELNLGPPADVYALGVLAFEICAGRPPFLGRNFAEMAIAHTTTPPPPLPGVPKEIADVVARSLDKDPGRRPTAEVLARTLRRALGHPTGPNLPTAAPDMATLVMPDNNLIGAATIVSPGPPGVSSTGHLSTPDTPGATPATDKRRVLQSLLFLSAVALLTAVGTVAYILFR